MYMAWFSDVSLGIVVWWAPWFGWFRAIQMITQRHESKFWFHVKSSSIMFLLLSPQVLIQSLHHGYSIQGGITTHPHSQQWGCRLTHSSPNRSDTACHNIKLMGKQGHVEENKIGSCLRISNLSKLQADDFKDFQIIIPKKACDTSPRKPSITHLIQGKPAQVKGLSADSDVNHTGRARSL